ncbi:hypothetical protein BCR33DRAFT_711392 [Rhizoclosmatium globosum]|uniref:[histone H3]-lysine(36) N-trimethyltransferase n=1 Tax=Rhizoclosmatium globosum TaxID=329046 RepID=A0A1Y2D1K5_9FUNG|nr:hypothetical protein BCR33DRAFT_711392 [Rhizoclosmatium globosum]|eukprot:ORY52994.1 hypothetical protein BCR33DRAFT_711392 [Rhizoclosmatium globosum]
MDQDLAQELTKVYTHIDRNEYKGGADGKIHNMEVMPCMCSYQHGDDPETACGESSDCINRALFLECSPEDCPCGYNCLNGRGQFVIEYCGEVITQQMFIKRVRDYSQQGAKHFYFMSIKSDEVIDAYKKGNIARFMNHSCVPNCELQKWVVGNQIRMGFFTVSDVEAGTELTFDYKFERYGAEPQICYCGHSACKGIIGGQQKQIANLNGNGGDDDDEIDEEEAKLSAKPKRGRSVGMDEDDYESSQREERGLQTVEAVQSFVKLMLYSTSKTTKLIRLLQKLEATTNVSIQKKFLQYHGFSVLKSCLAQYCKSNVSICFQTLRILKNMPPVSRNMIVDSRIEDVVSKMADPENSAAVVAESAKELLETWGQYPTVYRIPKKVTQPSGTSVTEPNNETKNSNLKRSPDAQSDSNNSQPQPGPTAADLFTKRSRYEPPRSNSSSSDDVSSSAPSRFDYINRTSSNSSLPPRPSPLINQFTRHNTGSPRPPGGYTNSPRGAGGGGGEGQSRVVESVLDTLPKGWKVNKTEEGRLYYYNHDLGLSRWDFPRDSAAGSGSGGVAESSPDGTVASMGSSSASAAVVPEVRVRSSMIEGLDEAAIEAIVQKVNTGGFAKSPVDEEASLKALRGLISELVVKTLSRYKETLGSEKFKHVARKCTHDILEREIRHKTQNNHKNGLSDETKVVMKKAAHVSILPVLLAART